MLICLDQRTGSGCGSENPNGTLLCRKCGKSLHFALRLLDPSTLLRHYRIIRVIGRGGFGAVYEARVEKQPDVRVALKESFQLDSFDSFQSEFAVLRSLRHDNLPRYYEVFQFQENSYLVMELVAGQSLADILTKQTTPLLESQVLGYALQLCDVLSYLHAQQPPLIHRDIKPANIRLTPEGLVKLVDFGLLKQGTETTRSSRRGLTPIYAPPEQWDMTGQHTDARSDIYSLGATLYHLLTGEKPPPATTRLSSSVDPLVPPRQMNPRISPTVARSITTAIYLQREQRYESAAAFKHALMGTTRPLQPDTLRIPDLSEPELQQVMNPQTDSVITSHSAPAEQMATVTVFHTLAGHARLVTSVAWSPDGHMLASGGEEQVVRLWQVADWSSLRKLQGHTDWIMSIAWSPDGQLLASASADRTIRLWRISDGRLLRTLSRHADKVTGVDWSPDGQMLASASADNTIRLWHSPDGRLLRTLQGHTAAVHKVAWSSNGKLLASASADKTVRLWRGTDGLPLRTLRDHTDEVNSVAWSPDGEVLASAGVDGVIRLWKMKDGTLLYTLQGHTHWVSSIAWRPDGQMLASGSSDKTVCLWRVSDGSLLHTLQWHIEGVSCVTWSPDGYMLTSASGDATVRLWHVVDN